MIRWIAASAFLLAALPGTAAAQAETPPGTPAPTGPLETVPVLSLPDGPRILRLPNTAPGTVALRLSVPFVEAPIEAGWGRVLALMARERLVGLVRPLGVAADVSRTPWGLVYSVSGPSTDFDHLAWILREVTSAPDPARVEAARTRIRAEWVQRDLTGRGRLELQLLDRGARTAPPLDGDLATLDALSPGGLVELWSRSHRRESMTLLVVGDLPEALLLASFDRLGATGPAPAAPTGVPVPAGPRAEALDLLRTTTGVAWRTTAPLRPEAAVTAILLTSEIRGRDPGFEARVFLWETRDASTVAIVGAAFRRDLAELRAWLSGGLDRLADGLTEARVRQAAAIVRAEALALGRTPLGQTRLVGRFLDAGYDDADLALWLRTLETLDVAAMRTFLDQLGSAPLTVELDR